MMIDPRVRYNTERIKSMFMELPAKKNVGDLKESDLKGKKVLVRTDFNVPLDANLNVTDDTKLINALPTLNYLINYGAKIIICSHLVAPHGRKYSLKPVVSRLSELLGVDVEMTKGCIGMRVHSLVSRMPNGGVVLLENVRLYRGELKNAPALARILASYADLYVNDCFLTAHRTDASSVGVTKFLRPSVAGFLMQKELDYLIGAVLKPKRPFAAIVGGIKLSREIRVIEYLLEKVDILILGGRMISTFNRANGLPVGSSPVQEDMIDTAKSIIEKAKVRGVVLHLPVDVVIADQCAPDASCKTVAAASVPDGWMILDIGSDSIQAFNASLDTAKTVLLHGSLGVYNFDKFEHGTEAITMKLAELTGKGVTTIVAGGESIKTIHKLGYAEKVSHTSTGGVSSDGLLEGKLLPGIYSLDSGC
ncbi:hypothetical protein C5167_030423 [Papaver somniferum]|uniref:phosphoglycerate kinase, cytosolic-like n=1 Tax=Papaver somniferum TaxID=3469 RepID=UPI000E6FCB64|nr:phosphoglycerate kinase, cytosolic-like [Papaver somniferum]RZC93302.1 hypothetical protein C5167_030423 [Papaver somniferum]